MKVSNIAIIPASNVISGQPVPADVVITMDDGSSYSAPVVLPNSISSSAGGSGNGTRGSLWTSGDALPTVGNDTLTGDMYFCTSNSVLYQYVDSNWKTLGVFKGTKGDPGTKWYTGIDPSTSGYTQPSGMVSGDMYLASDTDKIYTYNGSNLVYTTILNVTVPTERSATLSSDYNTTGKTNMAIASSISLPYAGGINSVLGVGDHYGVGPSWLFLHLKPAQDINNIAANPDLYLIMNQNAEIGYNTVNDGTVKVHLVSSPSDTIHDTGIDKVGVRSSTNRRDPIYMKGTDSIFRGITSDAISGSFGCNTSNGQTPIYSMFLSSDKKSITYSTTTDTDSDNPSLSWGIIPLNTNSSLEGVTGWGRKQWDARVSNDGDTMTIYNDFGPANAFANDKVVIEAHPIDTGLVGRLGATMCIPIANSDGTCTTFTFHGPAAAYYRFVATGLLQA